MKGKILDSHALYWFAEDDPKMPPRVKDIIEDEQTEVWVSVVSIWELAIKAANGKLELAAQPEIYFSDLLKKNGFSLLNVTYSHVILAARLPLHHKDPFDRLIIAQSLVEQMPVISVDEIFDSYDVTRIW